MFKEADIKRIWVLIRYIEKDTLNTRILNTARLLRIALRKNYTQSNDTNK
jgi:hypothetical protein